MDLRNTNLKWNYTKYLTDNKAKVCYTWEGLRFQMFLAAFCEIVPIMERNPWFGSVPTAWLCISIPVRWPNNLGSFGSVELGYLCCHSRFLFVSSFGYSVFGCHYQCNRLPWNLVSQSIDQSFFIRQSNFTSKTKRKKCVRLPKQAITQQSWPP